MATFITNIKTGNQGNIQDDQRFIMIAVVKEGISGTFESVTNINDSLEKCFILCSNTLEDEINTITYFSNDPNDFIPNNTKSSYNYGFTPVIKKDNNLYLDYKRKNHDVTIPLQLNSKFEINNPSNENLNLVFKIEDRELSYLDLNYGQPYSITLRNGDSVPFYVRTNKSSGKPGPSLAYFNENSSVFEYQNTSFYSSYGTNFTYDSDKSNEFGISRLIIETVQGSKNFSNIPIGTHSGIVELKQGTSVWYDIFDNTFGISDIYLSNKINIGTSFLNRTVFEPDNTLNGISVKINLRNREENFVSIPNISTTEEVFDFYLVNLQGFISSGLDNNSSQYHLDNGDIKGGICYFPNKNYMDIGHFHYSITQGFLNAINIINETTITKQSTNTDKLLSRHAGPNTTYSNHYDSLYAVDFEKFNSYDESTLCGGARQAMQSKNSKCNLHSNSNSVKANDIFTDNPKKGQNTYLIEIITMSVLIFIYIVFAIYYFSLTID